MEKGFRILHIPSGQFIERRVVRSQEIVYDAHTYFLSDTGDIFFNISEKPIDILLENICKKMNDYTFAPTYIEELLVIYI